MEHAKRDKSVDSERIHADFERYLQKCGFRLTHQRKVVLDAVIALGSHVDAEEIAAETRKIDPGIGLATVYRTLQLMRNGGIVVGRNFGNERVQFEVADIHDQHHDHLICQDCGTVIEFFDPELEKLQEEIAQRLGFTLTGHRMELFGKCSPSGSCARHKATAEHKD